MLVAVAVSTSSLMRSIVQQVVLMSELMTTKQQPDEFGLLWPDNHRLLWALSRLPRLASLTLAAAQHGGFTAERMFLSHKDLARLSSPTLRRLTADIAVQNSSNNIWLPHLTPLLESCTVRLASRIPASPSGMGFPSLNSNRLGSYTNMAELRVESVGKTAFSLHSSALVQLPQLKALSLHNTCLWKHDVVDMVACAPGLRELHISGWLNGLDTSGHPVFYPLLTRKLLREAISLRHLQCLRLTVCARPPNAPPESGSYKEHRLKHGGRRLLRRRLTVSVWNILWEGLRPEGDGPQLILSRTRLSSPFAE